MSGQIVKMSNQNEDLKGHMSCWRRKIISRPVFETAAEKRNVKEDKKDAVEVRKRAMERLRDRMKRNENEGKAKKRRSSGNNTLECLKERNERLDEFKKEELELRKQELQQEAMKNEAMMKLMGQQLQ